MIEQLRLIEQLRGEVQRYGHLPSPTRRAAGMEYFICQKCGRHVSVRGRRLVHQLQGPCPGWVEATEPWEELTPLQQAVARSM